tara:strand:- start:89 stop:463 length:375 start_codon:yes stop_codon:yes gene_type:complete
MHLIITRYLAINHQKTQQLNRRLRHPKEQIHENIQRIDHLDTRLNQKMMSLLQVKKTQLHGIAQNIHSLSPLNTLGRGYTIIQDKNDHVISTATDLNEKQEINIRFNDGSAKATINKIKGKNEI